MWCTVEFYGLLLFLHCCIAAFTLQSALCTHHKLVIIVVVQNLNCNKNHKIQIRWIELIVINYTCLVICVHHIWLTLLITDCISESGNAVASVQTSLCFYSVFWTKCPWPFAYHDNSSSGSESQGQSSKCGRWDPDRGNFWLNILPQLHCTVLQYFHLTANVVSIYGPNSSNSSLGISETGILQDAPPSCHQTVISQSIEGNTVMRTENYTHYKQCMSLATKDNNPSFRWWTVRARCQLKSGKMLHKCSTDCTWKGLQRENDLQGHLEVTNSGAIP